MKSPDRDAADELTVTVPLSDMKRWASELATLRRRVAELEEALRQIAEHPHQAYDHPSNESQVANYGMGCADGHRCAANSARAALSQEGDAG